MSDDHNIERIADLLKILAHPLRLKIILLLAQEDSLNVSTIEARLQIKQALLSTYLIKMRDKGFLTTEYRGKQNYYSLADPILIALVILHLQLVVVE